MPNKSKSKSKSNHDLLFRSPPTPRALRRNRPRKRGMLRSLLDDALCKTIDQLCQQLGSLLLSPSVQSSVTPSPTSVANSSSMAAMATTAAEAAEATSHNDHVPPPPAALSHLILSHPNSSEGKRDRSNRNHSQNCLILLDECVDIDGTVKNLASAADSSKIVLEALVEIGRRC